MSATDRPVHNSDPSEHLLIVTDEALSVDALMALICGADDDAGVVMMGESDRRGAHRLADGVDAIVSMAPVTDAIKRVDADGLVVETVDRSELRSLMLPLMIRVGSVRAALTGRDGGDLVDPISLLGPEMVVVAAEE
jgi:hypothetical protein